jgi:hypothetical protein
MVPTKKRSAPETDPFVLRTKVLASKRDFWRVIDMEREAWNRRYPRFKIPIHELAAAYTVEIRDAVNRLAHCDPPPPRLGAAFENFLKTLQIRRGPDSSRRARRLGELEPMDDRDWQQFADVYPALNEWTLRVSLLLRRFYPEEDLFEASYPVDAFSLFDERRKRHPAGAFIAACLLWGKNAVGHGGGNGPRIYPWVAPRAQRLVLLGWDPRGPSPAEVELRTELIALQSLIAHALQRGDTLDYAAFIAAVRTAKETARGARKMASSGHPRYIALPLGGDLRAIGPYAREEQERHLGKRIRQLHQHGMTANAIAERLGRDPQTVRRKLAK